MLLELQGECKGKKINSPPAFLVQFVCFFAAPKNTKIVAYCTGRRVGKASRLQRVKFAECINSSVTATWNAWRKKHEWSSVRPGAKMQLKFSAQLLKLRSEIKSKGVWYSLAAFFNFPHRKVSLRRRT